MATPHKCPVCSGTGRMWYPQYGYGGTMVSKCHACKGTGVVWDPDTRTLAQQSFVSAQKCCQCGRRSNVTYDGRCYGCFRKMSNATNGG